MLAVGALLENRTTELNDTLMGILSHDRCGDGGGLGRGGGWAGGWVGGSFDPDVDWTLGLRPDPVGCPVNLRALARLVGLTVTPKWSTRDSLRSERGFGNRFAKCGARAVLAAVLL